MAKPKTLKASVGKVGKEKRNYVIEQTGLSEEELDAKLTFTGIDFESGGPVQEILAKHASEMEEELKTYIDALPEEASIFVDNLTRCAERLACHLLNVAFNYNEQKAAHLDLLDLPEMPQPEKEARISKVAISGL